jgi:hypothetical protein
VTAAPSHQNERNAEFWRGRGPLDGYRRLLISLRETVRRGGAARATALSAAGEGEWHVISAEQSALATVSAGLQADGALLDQSLETLARSMPEFAALLSDQISSVLLETFQIGTLSPSSEALAFVQADGLMRGETAKRTAKARSAKDTSAWRLAVRRAVRKYAARGDSARGNSARLEAGIIRPEVEKYLARKGLRSAGLRVLATEITMFRSEQSVQPDV